jgi:hypothetical protein
MLVLFVGFVADVVLLLLIADESVTLLMITGGDIPLVLI